MSIQIKRNSHGSVAQYKASLVAKGFSQKPEVDFQDTFSPMVKSPTVWIILSMALTHKWFLRQLNVNNAFSHG